MIDLPYPWNYVVWACVVAVYAVISLVLFFRTKDVKYIKGVYDMIYRKPDYRESEPVSAQDFTGSQFKPVYRLNKQTGILELTDEVIDVQALIDSCRDVCLQACLERFMPDQQSDQDIIQGQFDQYSDDLDHMTDLLETAEQYRDEFGLSSSATMEDIFAEVAKRRESVRATLDNLRKKNNLEVPNNGEKKEETV